MTERNRGRHLVTSSTKSYRYYRSIYTVAKWEAVIINIGDSPSGDTTVSLVNIRFSFAYRHLAPAGSAIAFNSYSCEEAPPRIHVPRATQAARDIDSSPVAAARAARRAVPGSGVTLGTGVLHTLCT